MRKTKYLSRLFVLSVLLLTGTTLFAQQDPQFSQYMFNPLSVNPAYAGSRGVMNGALVYRQQWVSFPGAPNTQVFAINTPLRKGKVGIGLEFVRDAIGPKTSTGGYFSYAYRIPVGKGKLAFGLAAGALNYSIDWAAIDYKDPGDSYAQLPRDSKTFADFKFGMYFNNKKFFTGFSITHLNGAEYGHYVSDTIGYTASLRRHVFFTIGRAFALGANFTFSPSLMIRSVMDASLASTDLNLNFRYKEAIWFGVSLRSEKSVIVMAQYNINDRFKVGYSYDAAFGPLAGYHGGTHEIMLGFDLNVFQSEIMSPRFF
jgi:type IX secretion system PorP/SprF family membrane protein